MLSVFIRGKLNIKTLIIVLYYDTHWIYREFATQDKFQNILQPLDILLQWFWYKSVMYFYHWHLQTRAAIRLFILRRASNLASALMRSSTKNLTRIHRYQYKPGIFCLSWSGLSSRHSLKAARPSSSGTLLYILFKSILSFMNPLDSDFYWNSLELQTKCNKMWNFKNNCYPLCVVFSV